MKPGEAHDFQGVPIYPGDLIRSHHFFDTEGVEHYLYHTAVLRGGQMRLVPTSHLEPTKVKGGGDCLFEAVNISRTVVIAGHGPGDCLDYTDRPRSLPPVEKIDPDQINLRPIMDAMTRDSLIAFLLTDIVSLRHSMAACGMAEYPPVNGDPDGVRCDGRILCERCGQDYYSHPMDWRVAGYDDRPFLHVLCDGRRVKL